MRRLIGTLCICLLYALGVSVYSAYPFLSLTWFIGVLDISISAIVIYILVDSYLNVKKKEKPIKEESK